VAGPDRAREWPELDQRPAHPRGLLTGGKPDAAPDVLPDLAELLDRRLPRRGLENAEPARHRAPFETIRVGQPGADPPTPETAAAEPPPPLDGRPLRRRRWLATGAAEALAAAAVGASPHLLTGLVALLLSAVGPLSGPAGVPVAVLLVVLLQVLGYLGTGATELDPLPRIWLANLGAFGGVLPLLALLSILGGIPYVSMDSDSAWPFLLVGGAVGIGLVATALLAAVLTWESPEEASLLFVPCALLVPVVLGGSAEALPGGAVRLVALVALAAAAAVGIGWLLPRGGRLLVGPAALGAELAFLLFIGRRPEPPETVGRVVPVVFIAVLVVAILLTVAVPLIAVWLRRVAGEARVVEAR
jgi:MFS family permease